MRTWIRRPDDAMSPDDHEVLLWVKSDDLFYVLLQSGIFKLASMVFYEGMTWDWEPDERSFLELKGAK